MDFEGSVKRPTITAPASVHHDMFIMILDVVCHATFYGVNNSPILPARMGALPGLL
jgi:hypothetical protein